METMAKGSQRRFLSALTSASHIFVLTGVAIAQPLYDLLSRQAEFFIAHDARPIDLVLMALALSFLLPLALVLLTRSSTLLGTTASRGVHYALVAGLSGLAALQLLGWLAPSLGPRPAVAAAVAVVMAGAVLYHRWNVCRTFLAILSPAALLFPLLFLFGSPVRELVLPSTVQVVAGQPAGVVPVVMVIFDELPLSSLLVESGEVDPVRYPNLAALAMDAYWFRDATTASASTTVAVPIIVSGRMPGRRGLLPQAADHPDNLFTWLGAAGYRMNVFETRTRLCPPQLCSMRPASSGLVERLDNLATDLVVIYLHLLLPDALTVRLPAIEDRWSHFTATTIGTRLARMLRATPAAETAGAEERTIRRDDVHALFASFLENIAPGDRPSVHFIHLVLPHEPWRYLPSGREYGRGMFFPHVFHRAWRDNDEWGVIQGFQRHLLQVGYADRLIGQLVAKLEEQDLYDPALLVVVADHGATFRAQTRKRKVTDSNFADILNVPLFVKLPGQKRQVWSGRDVKTVDVLPTLADALDLDLPWQADGWSALSSGQPERPVKITHRKRSWDIATLRVGRARTVARKLHLFGSGAKPGGMFRIGRRADLVGRRVSDVSARVTGQPGVTIELNEPWSFEEVDPSAPYIPARISGRVRFARSRNGFMELAVAVNGTVEAVTQTFNHDRDRARFTAMVPERSLRAGRNLVEVFEIAAGAAGLLVPTRQPSGAAFTLVGVPGNEAIRTSDGHLIPLVTGTAGDAKFLADGRRAWIDGRAATRKGARRAEIMLLSVNGRCVLARDSELSRKRGWTTGRSGPRFMIRLPDALIAGSWEIRLFAVTVDAATEIAVR